MSGCEITEVEAIREYEDAKEQAKAIGLTVDCDGINGFTIADVPKASGLVCFKTLKELNTFIYGYRLGYNSGL